MRKLYLGLLGLVCGTLLHAQDGIKFDPQIDVNFTDVDEVQVPGTPIKSQVLFIGNVDTAAILNGFNQPNGWATVKDGNDFIGITPLNDDTYLVSVNHERSDKASPELGYGGGMTVFKVVRSEEDGTFAIQKDTLEDGRMGYFFNVEFDRTVGETRTNCGGIIGPDGSIWTAEEYPLSNNRSSMGFLPDTGDVIIGDGMIRPFYNDHEQLFAGIRIPRYQNHGYMVEIDPATARAIRKQYNWGRMSFEGGAISADNKTVYLAEDGTPGLFTKFVADVAGDFTKGKLYAYSQTATGANGHWVEMDNSNLVEMVNLADSAYAKGATAFIRLEWVTEINGKIYICETGLDDAAGLRNAFLKGGDVAAHHVARAAADPTMEITESSVVYHDYYGRILVYDPIADTIQPYLEGGPNWDEKTSQPIASYPAIHLSNPDGLGKFSTGGKDYLVINEDLNGSTYNRVPSDGNKICEMFLLDMSIANPTIADLIRIGAGPKGSELTGGNGTPDGKTILVDIQHPSGSNVAPDNNANTKAITGWHTIQREFINDSAQVFDGERIKRYQNHGYMVEIDPVNARAIRKQFNWGRMSFEGGAIATDNKTVYLAEDGTPGLFTKFVADNAGDFTSGKLYAYAQTATGANGHWVEMDNNDLTEMINLADSAYAKGATAFIRLEWVTEINGKIYICETGLDDAAGLRNAFLKGGDVAAHHVARANADPTMEITESSVVYHDYYGRILVYDPIADTIQPYLEGGPNWDEKTSQPIADYPERHLSNPDGLGKISFGGKDFLVINEDLNGSTYNRVPSDGNKICEMYLLDASIANPTIDDLIRIGVGPKGSELTGGNGTQDGKTILVDIQHPSGSNVAPDNNANTKAITGFDKVIKPYINDSAQIFAGERIKRYQNHGWMVEVDPKTGKAIRKQFNWGRMSFEGGAIAEDNKTVYLTEDGTPGLFTKFVADVAGDFTSGKLYAYSETAQGADGNWVEMDNDDLTEMINLADSAYLKGATAFIRLEWVTQIDDKVYICETGIDDASGLRNALLKGGNVAAHHRAKADADATMEITESSVNYHDYYGRILVYDPVTDTITTYLEGGEPYAQKTSQAIADYPAKHLSNPDGLGKLIVNGKKYLIINEDLNGSSYNRVPSDGSKLCEAYLLDVSIASPSVSDLIRIGVGPAGSELTGGNATPDGKTILVDIQHPSSKNKAPYNHATTIEMTGWDKVADLTTVNFDIDWKKDSIYQAPSVAEILTQDIFSGTVDNVTILDDMAQPAGFAPAPEQHDFIGITPDGADYWISVNHETAGFAPLTGNGGGMTSFKVTRGANDQFEVVETTLADGRKGFFHTIDFVNTVGETRNNCGGIISADGRIWTAEEYPRANNAQSMGFLTDTFDVIIGQGVYGLDMIEIAADFEDNNNYKSVGYPFYTQTVFTGHVDSSATLDYKGNPNGYVEVKDAHDFIGITPINDDYLISVNHETAGKDRNKGGYGGGMTTFRVTRDAVNDTLILVEQTLADGRTGYFFNVDFDHTVGETRNNCGGIIAPDGRIWTAEEYPRANNAQSMGFLPDSSDVIIGYGIDGIKDAAIDIDWVNVDHYQTVAAPLYTQTMFVGHVDTSATLDAFNQPNGYVEVKDAHDFIGITPVEDDYYISVNHETAGTDRNKGGFGGGMTTFRVTRDENNDTLMLVEQTLADGRTGYFFNVDFDHTVGETRNNCGGIIAPDGRIWTAEEYPRANNAQSMGFLPDTGDVIIGNGIVRPFYNDAEQLFDGTRIPRYQNHGWMVQIDPSTGRAIRKQYNWGRMSFEGGAIADDNKTVYLTEDGTPGLFTKFVADVAGDFTSGKLYAFSQDANGANGNWIEIDNSNFTTMVNLADTAYAKGATGFIRLEWIQCLNDKVYICETGLDKPDGLRNALIKGGSVANHHHARAAAQGGEITESTVNYHDYYGRILEYNPATDQVRVYLEGGPTYDTKESQSLDNGYPEKHLSNPDGLGKINIGGKGYLIICEDLNGSSYNRVPSDAAGKICEMYLLDASIENPTIDDLTRLMVGPAGAELTGGNGTQDGKSILVNIQHPSSANTAPYNNAVTVELTGFDYIGSAANSILSFDFEALIPAVAGTITDTNIVALVPEGTDLTNLVPTITVSEKAKISPASGVEQDFSTPVVYTVTSEGLDVQQYLVKVSHQVGFQNPSAEGFNIYPNPATRYLYFTGTYDVAIYDAKGTLVKTKLQAESINISELASGVYYIKNSEGEVKRLVVE